MKKIFHKIIHKQERGQAIVLIAFAMVGIVAMVGLVADTGILLIEYGKLKRSVDAAAIAAAQQYSLPSDQLTTTQPFIDAATNFINLNETNGVTNIDVHTCLAVDAAPPELCNDDPTHPEDNRKLVEVSATANINFSFLAVIGIRSSTVTATAIGEAATLDIVLVMDTSGSMAYETRPGTWNDFNYDSDAAGEISENPQVCNWSATNPCQPMEGVKQAALSFIDTLNFGYDRVAVVALTGQATSATDQTVTRYPVIVLPLSSTKASVAAAITGLKVFQPHECDESLTAYTDFDPDPGACIRMVDGGFSAVVCQNYQAYLERGLTETYNWAPCPSSNIGGALRLAAVAFSGADRRLDSFWVAMVLMSGPANASDTPENLPAEIPAAFPYGYCPPSTYYPTVATDLNSDDDYDYKVCTDGRPNTRHASSETMMFRYPDIDGITPQEISIYDGDDYARDRADNLANLLSGTGVTIYTIGLGKEVQTTSNVVAGEPSLAETLLEYIALEAGRDEVNHGQYFYAPTFSQLIAIFDKIAENIATKISQ